MKRIVRLLALVLALALVLSAGATCALAADNDPKGSITIKDPETTVNEHGSDQYYTYYHFFRILDLKGQDTDTDGTYDVVSYTITDQWVDFFMTGAGADYLIPAADATETQKNELNQIIYNGAAYYLNLTEGNVAAFADAATLYVFEAYTRAWPNNNDAHISAQSTEGDLTISNLPLGYYLMIPWEDFDTIATERNEHSSGSIASLTSTVPNAEIYVKATRPEITKTDDAASADVGQKINYTITGTVPYTAGYTDFIYRLEDYISNGLTFNNDFKITITHDGQEVDITDACTKTTYNPGWRPYGDGFAYTIPVSDYQNMVGDTITLTYSCTLNSQAIDNEYRDVEGYGMRHESNNVWLRYGHDPDSLAVGQLISEEVYCANIYINKYTHGAASDTPLEGARFVLMNSEGKYLKYDRDADVSDYDNPVYPKKAEWVTVTGAPTDGTAGLTNAQLKALSDAVKAGTISSVVSDEYGAAMFLGLKDDDYYLVEIEAPAGYNALEKPQKVVLQGQDEDFAGNPKGKVENVADGWYPQDSSTDSYANVLNQTGSVLPTTGGMGTQLFYILGGVLVLAAGVVLVSRRRMKAE